MTPLNARKTRWYSTGGPWGGALLLLGVVITIYGVALILARPSELRGALEWINQFIPVAGWGLVWVAAGIWSIARALAPPQRHIDVAPAVAVLCGWAGLYFVYWLGLGLFDGTWTRDWTGAFIFGAFAGVVIEFSRCVNPPRPTR